MNTVANTRSQKNLEDAKADYQEIKRIQRNAEMISYYKRKIEEEKEAIKYCMDRDLFTFAQSCLNRIGQYKNKIDEINLD